MKNAKQLLKEAIKNKKSDIKMKQGWVNESIKSLQELESALNELERE